MARRELAENEVKFLKEQLDTKDDRIEELESQVESLKDMNEDLQNELYNTQSLREHDLNKHREKELEKYKIEYEHVSKQKENIEVNLFSLKKENIGILNKNSALVEQKNTNQVLTNKLLENLKCKLIEKHESN
jgi:chromosome segregation ATPase